MKTTMKQIIIRLMIGLTIALMIVPTTALGQSSSPATSRLNQDTAYEITTVGGEDLTLTFEGITQDGITVGETTVTSQYPFEGMTFTVPISAEESSVTNVTLYLDFPNGTTERFEAELGEDEDVWIAHPFYRDGRSPAWRHFDFYWRIFTADDVSIDTPPHTTDYWDPTREWFRYENDYAILYWFGLEEAEPQNVAEMFNTVMESVGSRLAEGFGFQLDYSPIFLLYPSNEVAAEMNGTGIEPRGSDHRIGLVFDQVYYYGVEDSSARPNECIYFNNLPSSPLTEQDIVDGILKNSFALRYTYIYAFASQPNTLLEWWRAGQGIYFYYEPFLYGSVTVDERLWNLSELEDIPSLTENITVRAVAADGCGRLGIHIGASFIGWIVDNHGGLGTHAQIMANMRDGDDLYAAIENALDMPFLDIENAWRASVGYDPILLEDLDPTLALTEPVTSLYGGGDVVDVPGPRPMPLNVAPGPNQASNSACFAGSQIEILQVGSLDGINYYEVDCGGLTGWVAEEDLPLP